MKELLYLKDDQLKDLIKLEIIMFKKDEQDTRVKHVFLMIKVKKFLMRFSIYKKKEFIMLY